MSELDVGILKQEILSLLVSAKYGLSEHELLNDYRLFNSNRDLPYRDLGYPTLISLLRSWPDICRFQQQGNNGAINILAVEEENTKHILSMVKGQRPGKSRRRTRGGRNRGRGGGGGRNNARDNASARFSQAPSNINYNRPGGNAQGGSSGGRVPYNNNRSGRPNQNYRNRPNNSMPSGPGKYHQQIRAYLTGSSQSSYDPRQPINPNFLDDRRVINNSSSLRVTVSNNTNNNNRNQQSSETLSRFAENQMNIDEEQYNEEDDDREEEVINNLQSLLREYSHGIRLLALNDLYQKKYGKSLLTELKLANILLLQDFVDDFATISRHGEENGSCDHIITLKDPNQVAQTQAQLLKQITDSGTVPKSFQYANNLFSYINDSRFQGYISDIDKNEPCLHVQPVRYQEHIETLMEELDSYYSSPISNSLIINNIETGLSCVTKYDGIYHRVFIKESDLYRCVIVYVDYGTTEEINKDDQQFKYLLNHFAELPRMAIACRLHDVYFLPDDNQWSLNTYNEIYSLCQHGPFFIEPTKFNNGLLGIRILDADQRSLNDIVIELKLAVKISSCSTEQSTIQNASKPVELTFDFLNCAAQCPLPDSEPSTPETNTENINFSSSNNPSHIERQYKLIQIDENTSFYLIRYNNNKPYIPCFNLARLLQLSESDILSETLLPRIRFTQKPDNCLVFDCLKQTTDLKDCLHINQNFLFIFDLSAVLNYIERLSPANINKNILLEILRQQINASNEPQYWTNAYDYSKRPTSVLSAQSCNQTDVERYNELLNRRNILCNMLRTNDITECSLELESIENELQELIEKMRLNSTSSQNGNTPTRPPPGFSAPSNSHSDQQRSTNNKTDRLRDLMRRCRNLINTILVLDDYVIVDESITKYIQDNLPFLNSSKNSFQDDRLYQHYSDLLENLTHIVDHLQQQLPEGLNL